MLLHSSGQIRAGIESIHRSLRGHLSPHSGLLEVWTPSFFAETGLQPDFLCVGNKGIRRISVIQLCGGMHDSVFLRQPGGMDQLRPGLNVSHELSFWWSEASRAWDRKETWDLLISWLVDNRGIQEMERLTGTRRTSWEGHDPQAFEVARSLERAVSGWRQREAGLADELDVLGAERRWGRVCFPVCVNIASRKTKRLASIQVDQRPWRELLTLHKDLREFEGPEEGELIVDEKLEISAAWNGQGLEADAWEREIRMAFDWLGGGQFI